MKWRCNVLIMTNIAALRTWENALDLWLVIAASRADENLLDEVSEADMLHGIGPHPEDEFKCIKNIISDRYISILWTFDLTCARPKLFWTSSGWSYLRPCTGTLTVMFGTEDSGRCVGPFDIPIGGSQWSHCVYFSAASFSSWYVRDKSMTYLGVFTMCCWPRWSFSEPGPAEGAGSATASISALVSVRRARVLN